MVFDDTIANNISLWVGDAKSDTLLDKRIREAAKQAHIAHSIETLPDGYNTLHTESERAIQESIDELKG